MATILEKRKIIKETQRISREIKERTLGYLITALGLVAGLAWNDAIKTSIDLLFPSTQASILAKFLYALLITAIVVIISAYLVKLFKLDKND